MSALNRTWKAGIQRLVVTLSRPPALHSLDKKPLLITAGGVFLLCFTAYLVTMPHTVGFEDSGLFSLVCYYAGIAHPPGYPLYSILCVPFAHLPVLTPAHGVAIFSALCAAITAASISYICARLSGSYSASFGAGVAAGLSLHFWSQAITQEVYALNAMLFFLALAFALNLAARPTWRNLAGFVLFIGLGLSNHWPLFTLSGITFILALLPAAIPLLRWLTWRRLFLAAGILLLTLAPYLYLWLRSLQRPFVSFYGKLDTWDRFFFTITRKGYAGVDSGGGDLLDKQDFLLWLLQQFPQQISWLWVLPALIGLAVLFYRRAFLALGIVLGILGSTLLLVFLLHFQFIPIWKQVFRVYPLIPWCLLALCGGVGLAAAQSAVGTLCGATIARIGSTLWVAATSAFLLWNNGSANWFPKQTFADRYATATLDTVKKEGLILSYDDTHLPFLYKRYGEGYRPDITIYNTQSLILDNRITHILFPGKKKQKRYSQMAKNSERDVYFYYTDVAFSGYEEYGLFKYARRDLAIGNIVWNSSTPLIKLAETIDVFNAPSEWSKGMQQRVARKLAEAYYHLEDGSPLKADIRRALEKSLQGRTEQAYVWSQRRQPSGEFDYHINNLKSLEDTFTNETPYNRAVYYDYWGRLASTQVTRNEYRKVEAILLKGVEQYAANDSPPLRSLLELYAQVGDRNKFNAWYERYPHAVRGSDLIKNFLSGRSEAIDTQMSEQTRKENQALIDEAIQLLQEANAQQAAGKLEVLRKRIPGNPILYFLEGGLAMMERRFDEALNYFDKTIEQQPGHFDALFNKARILAIKGDFAAAQKALKEAREIRPDDPGVAQLQAALDKGPGPTTPTAAP